MEGSIAMHNVPSDHDNPAYDSSQPSSIEFDLQVTTAERRYAGVDGNITWNRSGISGDLSLTENGLTSTSRLTLVREVDGSWTASPDSEIEISGLGNASVEGTWRLSGPPSGRLTARGADVLIFDVSHGDEDGCVPYTINDKSGTVCVPPLDP